MSIRKARAVWDGELQGGMGSIVLGDNRSEMHYSYKSRMQDSASGTNPEELLGGAHAGCFSMALAHALEAAGHPPTHIETTARVHFDKQGESFSIPQIELETMVDAPGIEETEFLHVANSAKESCPVSKLFKGAEITLQAHLLSMQKS